MVVNHHFRVRQTHLSIYLSIYLSIFLSFLSIYLSLYIYVYIYIYTCICGDTIQDIVDYHTLLRDLSTTQLTLQLEVQLASERNIDQVLSEFREYASEVVFGRAGLGCSCTCFCTWKDEELQLPSGELTFCHGKSPFLMGKSTISMAIFNSFLYVHQRVCLQRTEFSWHTMRP